VGYFTPIKALWGEAFTLDFGPWEWFWVLFYGLATYGNAGWMREQVCKYLCPYARFQGAMFDRDTLIIGYDAGRGDPRGSRGRKADPRAAGLGDCIDCGLCVQVCPTGIDIRDGQQYECIGCAACVDVCDQVMDKMNYPRGLVRYATQNSLAQGWGRGKTWRRVLRPRVLVYTGVLLLIVGALGLSLALRAPFKVDVVRDRGALSRLAEGGRMENSYRLHLMNATETPQRYRVEVEGLAGARIAGRDEIEVDPAQTRWMPLAVQLPPEAWQGLGSGAHPIRLRVQRLATVPDTEPVVVVEKSTFVVVR
jgi:cytochrome c oxidase accessory protein FixG